MASASPRRKEVPQPAESQPQDEKARLIDEILGPGPRTGTKYLPEGFRRKNILMHRDHLYKLKALAYHENESEYEVLYKVMEYYLAHHKVKDIKPRRRLIPRK